MGDREPDLAEVLYRGRERRVAEAVSPRDVAGRLGRGEQLREKGRERPAHEPT
jgi:hypothetical protein